MPKASKETATGGGDFGPVSDRNAEFDGYTVNFVTFHEDIDATPLMKGLPDDQCQCPHWGYVLSGRVHYRLADGSEETMEAGDAFYLSPGHVPFKHEPGTQVVQWSPTHELRETDEAIMRNMQAMGVPAS
jgi:predicted class III extradiol MEMO1 family dioxygenase